MSLRYGVQVTTFERAGSRSARPSPVSGEVDSKRAQQTSAAAKAARRAAECDQHIRYERHIKSQFVLRHMPVAMLCRGTATKRSLPSGEDACRPKVDRAQRDWPSASSGHRSSYSTQPDHRQARGGPLATRAKVEPTRPNRRRSLIARRRGAPKRSSLHRAFRCSPLPIAVTEYPLLALKVPSRRVARRDRQTPLTHTRNTHTAPPTICFRSFTSRHVTLILRKKTAHRRHARKRATAEATRPNRRSRHVAKRRGAT